VHFWLRDVGVLKLAAVLGAELIFVLLIFCNRSVKSAHVVDLTNTEGHSVPSEYILELLCQLLKSK